MFNDNFDNNADQNNANPNVNVSISSLIQYPSIVAPYFSTENIYTDDNGFAKGSAVCTGGGPLAKFIIHIMPTDQIMEPNEEHIKKSIEESIVLASQNYEVMPEDNKLTIVFPLIGDVIFRESLAKKVINLAKLIMQTAIDKNNSLDKPQNLLFVDIGNDKDFAVEYEKYNKNPDYCSNADCTISVKNGNIFEILKKHPENYVLINPYHSNIDINYAQFLKNGGLTKAIIDELNQYNVILPNNEVKTAAECIYNYIYNQYQLSNKKAKDEYAQYLNPKFEKKITFFSVIYNFIKDTYLKIINTFTAIFTFIRNTMFSQATEGTNDDCTISEENKREMLTRRRIESQDSYYSNSSDDSQIAIRKIFELSKVVTSETPVRMPFYSDRRVSGSDSYDFQQSFQDDKLKCNNTISTIYPDCTEHEKSRIEDNSDDVPPLDDDTANVSNTTNYVDLEPIPGNDLLNEEDKSTINNKSPANTLKNR